MRTKIQFKFTFLLFFFFLFSGLCHAQDDWTGLTSSAWNNALNWTLGVPTAATQARIGVAAFLNQPTISASTTIGSLTLGSLLSSLTGGPDKVLTIITGQTLTITGDITANNSLLNTKVRSTITGGGAIICQDVNIGNSIAPINSGIAASDSTVISTLINQFTIQGNLKLTSTASANGNVVYFPAFNIDANNVTLNGSIVTANSTSASSAYNSAFFYTGRVNANNSNNPNTFTLNNDNPITTPVATNQVIDFDNGGSTSGYVIYNAASGTQTVYTNADQIGQNPTTYDYLTLSGASSKVFDGTLITIGGNLNSSGGAVNFNTNNPAVTLHGSWYNSTTVNQGTGSMAVLTNLINVSSG